MTDFSELGMIDNKSENIQLQPIDWNFYLQKGKENNAVWVNLLNENIEKLYEWNSEANKSEGLLASNLVISHRDLDSKNVMWNQGDPVIIDWESAGHINPMQDLIETAIYWSQNEIGIYDKERFLAFICAYKRKYGKLQADWSAVLASGYSGKLGWLEYSLKRSLCIECTDEKEQQMGTAQVTGTISEIIRYADMIPELEKWLNILEI